MILESLLKLAQTLKERVSTHGDTIGEYETRTRCALIDPLLRELGWDVSDPSAVIPEYVLKSAKRKERADYALLKPDGVPAMLVEAKSLGTDLGVDVRRQVLNYAWDENIAHFAITDGARWEIYGTSSPEPIVAFDLSNDQIPAACLKALALWRPSVESGDNDCPPRDWHRFTDTEYAPGRKPVELQFPDNARISLTGWFSLPLETVRWLSANGHLTPAHCPIMPTGRLARRYIVHTEPNYVGGRTFPNPVNVNGFYLDKHPQVKFHFGYAKTVINHVGQDPSQFRVRFAD